MFADLQFLAALLLGILSLVPSPPGTKTPQAVGVLLSPTFRSDYEILDQFDPWEVLVTREPLHLLLRTERQWYGIWNRVPF